MLMKPSTLFLSVSLVANLAGGWWLLRDQSSRAPAPAVVGQPTAATVAASADQSLPGKTSVVEAPKAPLTLEAYRDQLLAAGLPPEVVRAAIRALIEEPRLARQREIYAVTARQPWWQGGIVYQNVTPEQNAELQELRKAERAEILRVLGPAGLVADADRERYAYLSADKAEKLALLERETTERRRGEPGLPAAELQERQRQATADYERELAEILTPEERALLAERESNTARTLGNRFEFFAATDQEYRQLYDLQKAFDEKFSGSLTASIGTEASRARSDAMQQLSADIQAAFTPERYAAYLQSQRPEYRALLELQRRFSVPQAAFDQAARVHASVSAEAQRIADDSALSREDKRASLIDLAERARNGMRSALGQELGNTFITATSSNWIDLLERGSVYAAQPTGGMSTRNVAGGQPVPPPPPAPPPKS